VRAAMRKVADWELDRAVPYLDRNWTWTVLDTGFMAASRELNDPRSETPCGRWPRNSIGNWGLKMWRREAGLIITIRRLRSLSGTLFSSTQHQRKIAPTQKALDSLVQCQMPPFRMASFPNWWQWCDTLFMGPPGVGAYGGSYARH